MEDLPEELLIIIFKYCSSEDLQSIRQTCKLFYQVGTNKQLIKNEVLSIGKFERINDYKALMNPDCLRKFYICNITNIMTQNEKSYFIFQNLVHKFCESFRELYISNSTIPYYELMQILKKTVNLKILKLHLCSGIFVENLSLRSDKNLFTNNLLKELIISDCYSLTDYIISIFFKAYPNLNYLSIHNCVINTHGGIYSKYYRIPSPLENPSDLVFTYHCLKDLISQSQNNITDLNLSGTKLNDPFLKDIICSNPNLQLNTLDVSSCFEIKWNKIINDIVGKLINLTYINLSVTKITDFALNIICSESKNLNILIVTKCEGITDAAFENIINLQFLKEFEVGECDNVTANGVLSKLQKKINSKSLQSLNLSSISFEDCKIADYTLILSQLIKFDVSRCHSVDIAGLKIVFSAQRDMQLLNISGLCLPDDMFVILNSTENNQNILLKKLNNAINSRPADFCLANILSENIRQNKDDMVYNLIHLNLDGCKFTDKIFQQGFHYKNLRILNLARTVDLTINEILLLILKCPLIQELDLSFTNIDDVFVNVIAQGVKKLRYLNLSYCKKITNGSLDATFKYGTKLKTLNVANCSKLSLSGISKLHSRMEVTFKHYEFL